MKTENVDRDDGNKFNDELVVDVQNEVRSLKCAVRIITYFDQFLVDIAVSLIKLFLQELRTPVIIRMSLSVALQTNV